MTSPQVVTLNVIKGCGLPKQAAYSDKLQTIMAIKTAQCSIPLNAVSALHVVADDVGTGTGARCPGSVYCSAVERVLGSVKCSCTIFVIGSSSAPTSHSAGVADKAGVSELGLGDDFDRTECHLNSSVDMTGQHHACNLCCGGIDSGRMATAGAAGRIVPVACVLYRTPVAGIAVDGGGLGKDTVAYVAGVAGSQLTNSAIVDVI